MQFTRNRAVLFILLITMAALVFFLVLFTSTRFLLDDISISLLIRESSLYSMLKWYYLNNSFRYTALFLTYLTLGGTNPETYLITGFIYYILLFAFFVFVIYKIIKELLLHETITKRDKFLLIAFSFVQVTGIYFLCSERIEIFGWITSTMVHVIPIVVGLFVFWLIIKREAQKSDYAFLFLSAICIAGAAEHIVAIICFLGVAYVFHVLKKKKQARFPSTYEKKKFMKTSFLVCVTAIIFGFVITNPGTIIRLQETHEMSKNNAAYDLDFFQFLFKPHKLLGILFAIVCWMIFPLVFKAKGFVSIRVKPVLFALLSSLLITMLASKASYNFFYVTRMYLGVDVILYALISVVALNYLRKTKSQSNLVIIGMAACLVLLALHDIRHIGPLRKYAHEFDEMARTLQKQSADKTFVYQLPDADLASPLSLGEKTNDIRNEEYCRFYGIKAKVSFIEAPKD